MKLRLLLPPAFAIVLLVACVPSIHTKPPTDFLGGPAPLSTATRTLAITPDTKWVNVTGGEIVKFTAGDKTFAWNFDVAETISSFELNQIAPPGILNREVMVYVSPNPLYLSDGNRSEHGSHRSSD